MSAEMPVRELLAVDLFDVSPSALPAYLATEVGIRSLRASEGNAVHAAVLAEMAEAREASRRLGSTLVQRRATGAWSRWFRDARDRRAHVLQLVAQDRRRRAVLSQLSREAGTR